MTGIPETLYKYRNWNDEWNKRNLTHSEIYFASASQFNDPYDCAIPFSYDPGELTEEKQFKKHLEIARKMNPGLEESEIHAKAYLNQQNSMVTDPEHIKKMSLHRQESFSNTFGVLSLTTKRNNFLMWSHYANSHNGYCIGYNSELLFNQINTVRFSRVEYDDELPKFKLEEDYHLRMLKYAFWKSSVWSYEEEYRMINDKPRTTLKLDPVVIQEIILGNKLSQSVKFSIIDLVKDKYPNAKIYDTQLSSLKFEVELMNIY
ncbi:DUF2971 domain-containing protein [Roseivirga pacifica]|uniref:DUF2971 domain-containing protein n=1 Tax=Roseivirga pacifica TaxID=1267423 RepID=UPI003BAA2ED6